MPVYCHVCRPFVLHSLFLSLAPVYVQTGQMAVPNKPSPLTNGGSSVFAQPGQNQALVSASAMASRKSRSSFLLAASRILASQKTEVLTKADEDGYK